MHSRYTHARSIRATLAALPLIVLLSGCAADMRGGGGFHAVREGVLYRGAQPTPADLQELHEMGIKTVINLRDGDGEPERQRVTALGMDYVHLPSVARHPADMDLAQFLSIVTDPARQPVFVHCRVGRDRTGLVCATFRLTQDGWDRDRTIRELRRHQGANVLIYGNLTHFVRGMDLASLAPGPSVTDASLPQTQLNAPSGAEVTVD